MKRCHAWALALSLLVLIGLGLAPAGIAAEKATPAATVENPAAEKTEYVRITRDDKADPLALETAIVRFVPAKKGGQPIHVDLVAVVHVGEKAYYKALNERFASYDVVLYELVAPEGTQIPQGGGRGSSHPVAALQKALKSMLQLEFQLELIDYTAKNFVHADMSPDEFAKSMKDRGESFWTIFLRIMTHAMAQQGKVKGKQPSDIEILMALFDKNRSVTLKRLMAEQLSDLDGSLGAIEGPNGSTLVSGRNQKALEVLRREIADGKTKIAIFYGAAHMPDFQTRLAADFGLEPKSTDWLEAWKLTAPPAPIKKAAPKPAAVQ